MPEVEFADAGPALVYLTQRYGWAKEPAKGIGFGLCASAARVTAVVGPDVDPQDPGLADFDDGLERKPVPPGTKYQLVNGDAREELHALLSGAYPGRWLVLQDHSYTGPWEPQAGFVFEVSGTGLHALPLASPWDAMREAISVADSWMFTAFVVPAATIEPGIGLRVAPSELTPEVGVVGAYHMEGFMLVYPTPD